MSDPRLRWRERALEAEADSQQVRRALCDLLRSCGVLTSTTEAPFRAPRWLEVENGRRALDGMGPRP